MIYPKDYKSDLDLLHTEIAIKMIKDSFERNLAKRLGLTRVSAPLFVYRNSGLNDDLSGTERPVSFDAKDLEGEVEIIHSLAKWKRYVLKKYGIRRFKGIYTDMNAIRRDETLDYIHSIYVDQWDWEKVILKEDRTLDFLYGTVDRILQALSDTYDDLRKEYPEIKKNINTDKCFCITSEDLYKLYPDLEPKQREYEIVKKHKTVFISQIGDTLPDGKPQDGRAPDYDCWRLNGDLLVWYDLLKCPIELSSMGIRVDKDDLLYQIEKAGCKERLEYDFHKSLLNGDLPLTMGGGIGQSRLCMVILNKAHIGEVQASLWPERIIKECHENGIELL